MNTHPVVNNGLPIPRGFNQPSNRFDIDIVVRSDVSVFRVALYEYHGVYWFCLQHSDDINSRGFVGLRNCVKAMKCTVESIGFYLIPSVDLEGFVRAFEAAGKYRKAGA